MLSAGLGLAGGALAAGVAAAQTALMSGSAALIVLGFYLAYGRGMGGRWQRVVLWVSAPLTVLTWIAPYFKPP